MPKFRKIPVVINAEQWFPGNGAKGVCADNPKAMCLCACSSPHVHTAHNHQVVLLEQGDWIIPESNGDGYYPCKPDIFAATYEPVEG